MSDYQPIQCQRYDFIEIACMRHYLISIELNDETTLVGTAIDTKTQADKTEWLIIEQDGQSQPIRLDTIKAITPLSTNAEFGRELIAGN
ncbi:transcriptional antiterminator [Photobacterium profundum]|uniref:Transcriptional antiterminator, Rof n=1 Tax=Photobacterium profundum 3TCK TaxID=314280 RepID=Q1Z7T6_9GAMM|nr:Rho-binding antiterminator [Photobacterium profundum]EAS44777.1 Transcriptional antiterminator, Rof [Photobacterium profundum 3TCK]PSV60754.1 transcriptional antiterminator [Photobacterium profundum]